ncbi:hypothetical protein Taro_025366, partial [Colocasia esculenta]|nr:hypothetical protein [Colocasia esculenta]
MEKKKWGWGNEHGEKGKLRIGRRRDEFKAASSARKRSFRFFYSMHPKNIIQVYIGQAPWKPYYAHLHWDQNAFRTNDKRLPCPRSTNKPKIPQNTSENEKLSWASNGPHKTSNKYHYHSHFSSPSHNDGVAAAEGRDAGKLESGRSGSVL